MSYQTCKRTACACALLLLVWSAVLGLAPATPRAASVAQERGDYARRLAQTSDPTGPEVKAFRDGREALADERWARAEERFSDFANDYPKSKSLDAALYWLAFAQHKQEKFAEADRALRRLIKEFPSSGWAGDAQVMRVEIAPRLGQSQRLRDDAGQPDNEEARLLALRALFKSDPAQARERTSAIFQPGSGASKSFKESAIMLLGRHTDAGTLPLLAAIARKEPDHSLRKTAISWLGASGDESVIGILRSLALESDEEGVAQAALTALMRHGSQRAIEAAGDVAASAASADVRARAASLLGTGAGLRAEQLKDVWLLVRDRNRLRIVPAGHALKLVGAGSLKFREDGRVIEFANATSLTINGQPVFRENEVHRGETAQVVGGSLLNRERVVREREVVRAVDASGNTVWELSLLPEAGEPASDGRDWLTINGEFAVDTVESKTFILYPNPGGGLRLRR